MRSLSKCVCCTLLEKISLLEKIGNICLIISCSKIGEKFICKIISKNKNKYDKINNSFVREKRRNMQKSRA